MKHIMFNTDDWNLDHRVTSNVGYVTEVKGYNGETASVWRLADWNWSWTSLMHTFKPEKIRIIRLLFGLTAAKTTVMTRFAVLRFGLTKTGKHALNTSSTGSSQKLKKS